ncbi:hypothetical protein LZQ00_04030 [Sphingobacterium sp. SRCM116780]|uniref:hypothetical protein n=1 Tax=Sphingobacterium sp. SRCM116780 TaxID=2907623 RepID=UPI001F480BCD|nr:hypothetical protein [Sphingobacterium sp. SRCM116780]UIR56988.1 hypothetical protein LZQ00_04030 [Sphingobacterium sp. SRCM116780]
MNEQKIKKKEKYVNPRIVESVIEMESCIAAGSGAALPSASTTPLNETWDNADLVTDTPTYW